MNNASPPPTCLKPNQPAAAPAPGTALSRGSASERPCQPLPPSRVHGARHAYLDREHDVGLPLEHLHRLAMAYVFKLDSIGCKDLVSHPNAILLCQPSGVHPREKGGAGWGQALAGVLLLPHASTWVAPWLSTHGGNVHNLLSRGWAREEGPSPSTGTAEIGVSQPLHALGQPYLET